MHYYYFDCEDISPVLSYVVNYTFLGEVRMLAVWYLEDGSSPWKMRCSDIENACNLSSQSTLIDVPGLVVSAMKCQGNLRSTTTARHVP